MLQRDGERDRILDRGLTFEQPPAMPAPTPRAPFYISPPDWAEEERERKELERRRRQEERDKILGEELARLAAEDEQ